jgi:hypothetical protein
MGKLVNCEIILDIELIEKISGGNQRFEISFTTQAKDEYVLIFDFVWDMRYSIENGYIDRFYKFIRDVQEVSSVLLVENSDYIKYFENQVSGTRPIDDIKNYIIYDSIDTVIEILTIQAPTLIKLNPRSLGGLMTDHIKLLYKRIRSLRHYSIGAIPHDNEPLRLYRRLQV